jgi:hypothetical protein
MFSISNFLLRVLSLTEDTQRITADIKEIKQEVRHLSDETKRLAAEIERLREVGHYEHENMMLQINNTLLQFERRLPPS